MKARAPITRRYVCFNALKCFETLIPKIWHHFSAEQRLNIREFFWNILIRRGPKFPRNVTSYTAKIFCRISKVRAPSVSYPFFPTVM